MQKRTVSKKSKQSIPSAAKKAAPKKKRAVSQKSPLIQKEKRLTAEGLKRRMWEEK